MFNGNASARIESSKDKNEVFNIVEENLEILGNAEINHAGDIYIPGNRFNGFGYNVTFDGVVKDRNGYFTLDLDYSIKPDIFAWLIAICFFPVGLVIFLLPYNAKEEIHRKAKRAVDDIHFELRRDDKA